MRYFNSVNFLDDINSFKTHFKNEGYQTAYFNKQYIKHNIWEGVLKDIISILSYKFRFCPVENKRWMSTF